MTGYGVLTIAHAWLDWGFLPALAGLAGAAAVVGGLFGFYYMYKLYRIKARPYWDHWQTASSFVGTALYLGAALIALVGTLVLGVDAAQELLRQMGLLAALGLLLEGVGLIAHAIDLRARGGEGAAALAEQSSKFGRPYLLRNILLGLNLLAALLITAFGLPGAAIWLGLLFLVSLLAMAIIGRALFYVLVIPTTMPGAFFWRNRGFQEHARETGLANLPTVGVVPEGH